MKTRIRDLRQSLSEPIDGASLATFRFMFGWLMLLDVIRYVRFGWVGKYYLDPNFHFTYFGFHWLSPWPGVGLYAHFIALGLCAVGIALGYRARLCAALFTLGFTYVFLLEKAHYLNHFYVIILLSGVVTLIPSHHTWSLDAHEGRVEAREWVPRWALLLLRSQLLLIYVFAGIAKLNLDWLGGEPMGMWLSRRSDIPLVGGLIGSEFGAYAVSYLGIFVDLILPFFLLPRRTRAFALIALACFHLSNAVLFSIGIFPWLMLSCNLLFLSPSWPRMLPARVKSLLPLPDNANLQFFKALKLPARPPLSLTAFVLLGSYLLIQILLPLRHHLYPGDVAWTEEGHRFSWRMKLRDKQGSAVFFVTQPGESTRLRIEPADELEEFQVRKMTCEPDMLLVYAQHLAQEHQKAGRSRPKVSVETRCSLNGQLHGPIIDPDVDLGREEDTLLHVTWLMPRPPRIPNSGRETQQQAGGQDSE